MSIPVCDDCGASPAREVLYGLPTPEASERARRGEVVLAGCFVWEGRPEALCDDCVPRRRPGSPDPGDPARSSS